ncbi:MAG: hypothetical protein D6793_01710 [Thermoflexia bacterium]|nr:MAG: hypothetical protein D6793_01710 [Thermoflexia bacterium]
MEEIQETCPDLAAIIDGTEQRIQRPQDNDLQRQHDSGRRKAHTRKTMLVTNEEGRIRMVAPSVPGSCHDLRATVESGIAAQIPEEVPVCIHANRSRYVRPSATCWASWYGSPH